MAWKYEQASGAFFEPGGRQVATGYSGFGEGKNNPEMVTVHDVGPIPQGRYAMGKAYRSPALGPIAMNLEPTGGQAMYGRSAFRIHGDSSQHPGQASHGCIILPRAVREVVAASEDRELAVV